MGWGAWEAEGDGGRIRKKKAHRPTPACATRCSLLVLLALRQRLLPEVSRVIVGGQPGRLSDAERIDDGGSPRIGCSVTSVARKDPVVAFVVERGELKFAIFGFVRFFGNSCAGRFRAPVVPFHIFHKN